MQGDVVLSNIIHGENRKIPLDKKGGFQKLSERALDNRGFQRSDLYQNIEWE